MSNEEGAKSKWLKINLKVSLYQIGNGTELMIGQHLEFDKFR